MQNTIQASQDYPVFTSQQVKKSKNKNNKKKQNKQVQIHAHQMKQFSSYNQYNNNRAPFLSEEESEGEQKSYQNQLKNADFNLEFIHIVCDNEVVYSDPQIDPEKLSSSQDEESSKIYAMGSVYKTVDSRDIGLPSFI
ncbi:hypothetical protein PPERSA_07058 [Pseudocohnilembus persalinus]|uniref:Uncharacterized protein n=1 Tax=Pseudocohnilembus persalinus TaxID=266149 RepID=A0A0V0QAN2_PSEPJ|nr:hypothetical protein PPERSA_07058 [Pseudocohnilembus persalinus]|eukprot:KRW99286.1 hypothetical protein PPERSA_07058 [Pseudocohnilembus persalinus]